MGSISNMVKQFFGGANKKLITLIAVAVVAVIVLGAAIGVVVYLNSPSVVALRSTTGFVEDLAARDEIKNIVGSVSGGSIEGSLSSVEIDDIEQLEDFSASGKVYLSNDTIVVENAKVTIDDTKITGNLYISEDLIYIEDNKILKEGYGVRIKDLAQNLEDSIFAPNSKSDYAFSDEDIWDAIIEACEDPQYDKMQKDLKKITEQYAKDIWEIVCDNAKIESETKTMRINGEKQTVRLITIEIDGEVLAQTAEQVVEYLLDDNSVIDFLDKYESSFSFLSELEDTNDTLAEMYEEMLEELEEEIEDYCELLEDSDFELTLEVATPRFSSKLSMLNVELYGEEIFNLEIGNDGIKKTNKISLDVGGTSIVYEVTSDDGGIYQSVLEIDDEEVASIKIDYEGQKFEVIAGGSADEPHILVKGKISQTRKSTSIEVSKIEFYVYDPVSVNDVGEMDLMVSETITTNLKLTFTRDVKMPSAPREYTTIDEIKEKDINAWIERFEELADEIGI